MMNTSELLDDPKQATEKIMDLASLSTRELFVRVTAAASAMLVLLAVAELQKRMAANGTSR